MARRSQPVRCPVALTIAGSDSGGGAGIQADLRAFAYFRVFGTTAVTVVTAQNPQGVTGVEPVAPDILQAQMRAVFGAFTVGAIKTGMLFSRDLIRTVSREVARHPGLPLVVDPVMVATSGARLLHPDAVETLIGELLPLATLITPNLPEAEVLLGRPIPPAELQTAGRALQRRHGCAVLLKGGHVPGAAGTDYLFSGENAWCLTAPEVDAPLTTHGTGCSLSAAIAACLARDMDLLTAVRQAKAYVLGALRGCAAVGRHTSAMLPPPRLPLGQVRCRTMPPD